MSKTIYIGGRLESKEKGNVVTGANAILDDTKGKKQNVINKETDDELLRLEQSKQDNLNFDNAPTEDSTNPVTSGGVYTAEKALNDAIEAILLLIPGAATALNKLVDTNTMNSSISTATATFCGTYNAVSDLGLTYQATHAQIEAALDALGLTADNNDFAFVQIPVSDQSQDIAKTERFKFNGTNWLYEYDLNTSGFTAAQWGAINSGITVALVTKLTDLPTAAALQLALNAKQDTLTFDNEPTALSQNPVTSGGIYTAIQAVATALSDYSTTTDGRLNVLEGLVPTDASSSNQLTDKAYVDGLIQAITELIPAEADTTNQLADKAYVLAQILAATPAFKGQFTKLAELQAVASPKAGDLGIVRTKDSDGMDVFTVYQYLNNAWNVFYSLSYHPQTKPATTGTTGDYPYNGMGRVELAMNMVNTGTELDPVMVNTLTQDMFYKGAVGSRVPNTNTIFVIRYDYVLAENITIPDNCVLEFEGGSISGAYTLTGANTTLCGDIKCFVTIAGTFANNYLDITWFGAVGDDDTDSIGVIRNVFSVCVASKRDMYVPKGIYAFKTLRFDFGNYSGGGASDLQPETYYDCHDITVFGDGMYSSIFNSHTSGDILNIACAKNVKFKNIGITLDEDYTVSQAPGINCISLVDICNIEFDHVYAAGGQSFVDAIGQDGGFGFTIQASICDNVKLYNCHMKNCFGGFDLYISNNALNREQTNIELHSCIAEKCEKGYWFRNDPAGSTSPYIKSGIGYVQGKSINCMHSVSVDGGSGYDINVNVINTETIDNIIRDYKGNYYWPQAYWSAKNFMDVGVIILRQNTAHNNNIKIDAFAKEINCGFLINDSNHNSCNLTLNNDATLQDMYTTPVTQVFKTEFVSVNNSNDFYILNCKESDEAKLYIYSLLINQNANNVIVFNNVLLSKDSHLRKVQFITSANPNNLSATDLMCYGAYPMFNNKDTDDSPIYKCFEVGQAGTAYGGMNAFGDLLRSSITAGAPYGGVNPDDIAGGLFIDVRDINSVSTVLGHIQVSKKNRGATTDRPSLAASNAGYFYYDTTLNKPVWWTGAAWVDATGASA